MFPDGAPVNSICNVQNKSFKTCGEIVAASLAQGGPSSSFLAEPVYELMLTLEVKLDQLDAETHFTPKDKELFGQIRNCDSFDDSLSNLILDHGYTGPLDKNHQDDIIGTIQVSIMNKRLLYLREFCEGLKLFHVYALVKDYAALCKDLFVPNTSGSVDSDMSFHWFHHIIQQKEHQDGSWRRKSWTIFKISYQLWKIRTSRATQKHWLGRRRMTLQMKMAFWKLKSIRLWT